MAAHLPVLCLLALCLRARSLAPSPALHGALSFDAENSSRAESRGGSRGAWPPTMDSSGAKPTLTAYCMAPLKGHEGKSAAAAAEGLRLAQVHVMTRHGARSALFNIEKQTNDHAFTCDIRVENHEMVRAWPELFRVTCMHPEGCTDPQPLMPKVRGPGSPVCADGQLLNRGMTQMRELGGYIQQAYSASGILEELSPESLWIRSTDTDRTQGSAASFVSGLLKPNLTAAAQRGKFTILVYPREQDTIFGVPCQRADDLSSAASKYMEGYIPNPELSHATTYLLGTPEVLGVADDLLQTYCDGGDLPCGPGGCVNKPTAAGIERDLDTFWCETYGGKHGGLDASRLRYHVLLKEIAGPMRAAAEGRGPGHDARFALYSGHDSTVAPFGAALGFFAGKMCIVPPIASRIVFELWTGERPSAAPTAPTNKSAWPFSSWPFQSGPGAAEDAEPAELHKVRVLYNGEVVTHLIDGCGGGELCPLAAFEAYPDRLLGGHRTLEDACAPAPAAPTTPQPPHPGASRGQR